MLPIICTNNLLNERTNIQIIKVMIIIIKFYDANIITIYDAYSIISYDAYIIIFYDTNSTISYDAYIITFYETYIVT